MIIKTRHCCTAYVAYQYWLVTECTHLVCGRVSAAAGARGLHVYQSHCTPSTAHHSGSSPSYAAHRAGRRGRQLLERSWYHSSSLCWPEWQPPVTHQYDCWPGAAPSWIRYGVLVQTSTQHMPSLDPTTSHAPQHMYGVIFASHNRQFNSSFK